MHPLDSGLFRVRLDRLLFLRLLLLHVLVEFHAAHKKAGIALRRDYHLIQGGSLRGFFFRVSYTCYYMTHPRATVDFYTPPR